MLSFQFVPPEANCAAHWLATKCKVIKRDNRDKEYYNELMLVIYI